MALKDFSYNSFNATIALANQITRVFNGNIQRVALIVAYNTAAGTGELSLGNGAVLSSWARMPSPNTYSFSLRDYGPLIWEPLQIGNNAANCTVTITEIIQIH